MKTTAKVLAGWGAVALVLGAGITVAGPPSPAAQLQIGTLALTQAASPVSPSDKKQAATDLLRRARRLMADGDLDGAGQLISQAEALNVDYGVLPFGDTPKKARRDLDRKRGASGSTPLRPSNLFSHLAPAKKTTQTDPFAGRSGGTQGSPLGTGTVGSAPAGAFPRPGPSKSAATLTPLGPPSVSSADLGRALSGITTGQAAKAGLAGGNSFTPPPAAVGSAMATDANHKELLLEGRRALAVGDLKRAGSLAQQAKAHRAAYGPLDDTPVQLEAAIRKYQEVMSQPKHSEAYRRGLAKMLMEQSEALLRAGDLDQAEQLADRASRQGITYEPFELTPKVLLERIAVYRQGGTPTSSLPPSTLAAGHPASAFNSLAGRQRAIELTRQAREALKAGQMAKAEALARQAEQLGVPDAAFAPGADRPGLVLFDIRRARPQTSSGVIPVGAESVGPAIGNSAFDHTASPALYDSLNDPTRNMPAQFQQPEPTMAPRQLNFAPDASPPPSATGAVPLPPIAPGLGSADGLSLFQQGEAALRAHDADRAYQLFRQAGAYMDQLDPTTRQQLQTRLQMLSVPNRGANSGVPTGSAADQTAAGQQVLARQLATEVAHQEVTARNMLQTDPNGALTLLEDTRKKVEGSGLESSSRGQLLRRIDRSLSEARRFIEQNRPRIELEEKNQQVRDEIKRDKRLRIEIQEKLALMVDDFNRKMDEERFEEAEVVAKRAAELAPDNPLVQQLLWNSKFVRRFKSNEALRSAREAGYWDQMDSVAHTAIPEDDRIPFRMPAAKDWEELSSRRLRALERAGHRTQRELEIEQKLRTPIPSLQFTNEPLSSVLDHLAKLAGVNLHLDQRGLADEGITSDTPVTINLTHEIMLKSALNLILEELRLSFVIKDEVLKITSEQLREGEVFTVSYNVADLVVPIPNFVPTPRMGLAGAYHDALGNVGFGGGNPYGTMGTPMAVVASKEGNRSNAAINPAVLAQMSMPGQGAGGTGSMPMGFGPGGLGGGSQADFESLIELITSTIQPTTWDEVGGPGSIAEFETNLSLVVSQTQDVHEEIVDLLEQLRRLQDLQVTIEVRFITLNDNFFERIGVDFDFDIDDDIDRPFQVFGRRIPGDDGDPTSGTEPGRNTLDTDFDRSVTVGMQAPGVFSADLDIPFTQNSFALAVPQFGGFNATAGAELGFAILSDIEAFFFINAAQGDRRSNVLQAPKVTLFNGQQAYVSDTSQSPFVISVIPVVGDFAAAQQPVIVVLSEGSFMTVQAVVSSDRRFVRLTVVPFFSKIGDVQTFQFTGTETTTTNTSIDSGQFVNGNDPDNDRVNNATGSSNGTRTSSGTTVQLPTFSFVTVTTTVSVPDGGTVLLGGIKRLSEGRNEFGVPILSKMPYLNRLFKNVGIGRDTQSLMMMVTPRIIIQEEEEDKLGI